MSNVATLLIEADRYGACVRQIYIRGMDLTGVAMRAQVRLIGDTPGAPLVDLQTVTNGNAEGLRLVSVDTVEGMPVSHVEMVINETTMEALPYAGELGASTSLAWDWQLVLAGRKQRIAKGDFVITGDGVTGADNAPSNRPAAWSCSFSPTAGMRTGATLTFGDEVMSVTIDGADLVAAEVGRAVSAQDRAEAAQKRADLSAGAAQGVARYFTTRAAGEAASAVDQSFSTDDGVGNVIYYRRTAGGSVEIGRGVTPAALAAPDGAGRIGFKQPDLDASNTTSSNKLTQWLEVEDFRTDPNGASRNDRTTLTKAFAAWQKRGSGQLRAQANRFYNIGEITDPGITEIFPLSGLRNAEFDANGAYIVMTSKAPNGVFPSQGIRPYLFPLRDYQNLTIKNLRVTDYGTNLDVNWQGVYVICPIGDQSNKSQSALVIDNVVVDRAVSFMFVSGTISAVEGIEVRPSCVAISCYYGLAFEEAGSNVTATLRTLDCMRSYFPYGVRGHKIHIQFAHNPNTNGAEAMCLIKRYMNDTGDIDLTITAKGSLAAFDNIVKLEHQPVSGIGTIENVRITYELDPNLDFDMNDAACLLFGVPKGSKTKPITMSSYTNGGVEEVTTTENIWRRILLAGDIGRAPGDHVLVRVKPSRPADIALMPGLSLNPMRCNTKGNVVFKTANNREFRTRKGDLTSAPIAIDLSGFDDVSTVVGVTALLMGGATGAAAQDRTYLEFNTFLTIPAGGPITINTTPNPVNNSSGVAATIGTLSASGKVLQIPVSGSAYAGAGAFAMIETIYRDQVPA